VRRRAAILIVVLLLGVAAAIFVYFRHFRYLPLPARLLPEEATAYIYVDLKPIRAVTSVEPGSLFGDPEVAEFSRATGIVPERDIDEVAVAVKPFRTTPQGTEYRSAEVFVGRFDAQKLAEYLKSKGRSVSYRDLEVFEIPREDRMVRVSIVDPKTVLVSNGEGYFSIRYMVDKFEHVGFPRGGPSRLRRNFRRVPIGSIAWAVYRAESPDPSAKLELPAGLSLTLPRGTEVVASARALSSLQLRAEAETTRERTAKNVADQIATYLTLFRAIEISVGTGGADKDVKQVFDSIRVQQEGSRAIVTAEIPFAFLSKFARELKENPAQSREGTEQEKSGAQPNAKKP
jgi:hypothetical protein